MKIHKKITSIIIFSFRKSASEIKGSLNWSKIKLTYVCTVAVVVALTSVYFWSWYRLDQILRERSTIPMKPNAQRYANVGCVFPEVDPFSETALRYNVERPKVVCEGHDWVECDMSECKVVQDILESMRNIVCFYKDIIYVNDHKYTIAEPVRRVDDEVYVLNRSDGFKISCTGYQRNGFGLMASRWHGYKAGLRPVTPLPSPPQNDTINVLMVGFDSAARSGFILKMPNSYKVLTEELGAVVLEGYNIVGDGTPDALFPILSGKTELQHGTYARQRVSKSTFLDPGLFLFGTAREAGYHTAYYEDMPWIGSFQYRYNGFSKRPADHYIRSFLMEETKNGAKWHQGVKGRYCVGDKPSFLLLLDLTRQFMRLAGRRLCFTFVADISHDDFYRISTADGALAAFLRHVRRAGLLRDTLLVVMGDHGPRFGAMRATRQGKLDERLPFMALVLPERLKLRRPNALASLRANAKVLTTPFDLHTTVLDAMGLDRHASEFVVPNAGLKRGLSLLKPIPASRTCPQAGVAPHWCVCENAAAAAVRAADPLHGRCVRALLRFINNITEEMRSVCAVRNLTSTLWVTRLDSTNALGSSLANTSQVIYYQALVWLAVDEVEGISANASRRAANQRSRTARAPAPRPHPALYVILSPGRAAFEASMQYVPLEDRFVISERDISRISAYGSEPDCVSATHPHLNKYCYCTRRYRASDLFLPH